MDRPQPPDPPLQSFLECKDSTRTEIAASWERYRLRLRAWVPKALAYMDELEIERDPDDVRGALHDAHVALGVVLAQQETGHDPSTYQVVQDAFDRVHGALMPEPALEPELEPELAPAELNTEHWDEYARRRATDDAVFGPWASGNGAAIARAMDETYPNLGASRPEPEPEPEPEGEDEP